MNYTTCVLSAHLDDLVDILSRVAQRSSNIDFFTKRELKALEKELDIITPSIVRLREQFENLPTNKIDREYET